MSSWQRRKNLGSVWHMVGLVCWRKLKMDVYSTQPYSGVPPKRQWWGEIFPLGRVLRSTLGHILCVEGEIVWGKNIYINFWAVTNGLVDGSRAWGDKRQRCGRTYGDKYTVCGALFLTLMSIRGHPLHRMLWIARREDGSSFGCHLPLSSIAYSMDPWMRCLQVTRWNLCSCQSCCGHCHCQVPDLPGADSRTELFIYHH